MKRIPLVALLSLAASVALAEGTDQLNTTQALRSGAQLYVDILNPGTESIRWTGVGNVTVTAPDGSTLATLSSGDTADTTGLPAGAYGVRTLQGQVVGVRWDVDVVGQVESGGRLFSYDWKFNAGAFSSSRATFGSFYAVLPGGSAGETAVLELKLDGLAGYVYNINANRIGVDGPDGGRSVPMYGHTITPEFPIYISPPTSATYDSVNPEVYGLDYIGGVSESVEGDSTDPCAAVVPGESYGRFQFQTNVEGTYHLECDLNQDGVFDSTSDDDFLAIGTTEAGVNTLLWNGVHQGSPIDFGTYNCRVRVNVGEFHYVGSDIETSYQGLRLYEVNADGSRRSLAMRWNDTAVQSSANTMPSGEVGLETSGIDGIDSGPYAEAAVANVNSRSWGNFTSSGKGNMNYLDTHVWLASTVSSEVQIEAIDSTTDTDGDGLGDFEEQCYYGTDPENPDTDGDGVDDGTQYGTGSSSGSVGGLESNGRLADQLARRAIRHTRMTPQHHTAALTDPVLLEELIAALELEGRQRVVSTPADLPSLTNAANVLAYDFLDGDAVAASVLVVETEGELYEHSKALCDRAGGSTLLTVGPSNGFLRAAFRHGEEATLDHAVEFKLYAEGDRFRREAHWLSEQYAAPSETQAVLNVQFWGRRSADVAELVQAFEAALQERDLLRNPPGVLDESSPDAITRGAILSAPTVAIASATLLGRSLDLTVTRFHGAERPIDLHIRGLRANGERLDTHHELLAVAEPTPLHLDVGLLAEATVDVYEDDTLVDRLWISDGAWAPFDDSLWGGRSEVSGFDARCLAEAHHRDGGLPLSGCAHIDAVQVDQFAGVARHIPRGIDLDGFTTLSFWYRSDRRVRVCLEDTQEGSQHCRTLAAAPEGRDADVGLGGLAQVRLLQFTQSKPGRLEVSGVRFHDVAPSSSGCSAAGSAPALSLLWGVAMLWVRRRNF